MHATKEIIDYIILHSLFSVNQIRTYFCLISVTCFWTEISVLLYMTKEESVIYFSMIKINFTCIGGTRSTCMTYNSCSPQREAHWFVVTRVYIVVNTQT